MKRSLVYCSFICAMMLGIFSVSAAPTDFSGTWVRDNAKSEGLGRMAEAEVTMMVKQDGNKLMVETKTMFGDRERSQSVTYNLDGSETTAESGGRMPGKVTSKAKWMGDGKILEINSTRTGNRDGQEFTITTKEHWELADGGKVLKVHSITETPQGPRETKAVYNKK